MLKLADYSQLTSKCQVKFSLFLSFDLLLWNRRDNKTGAVKVQVNQVKLTVTNTWHNLPVWLQETGGWRWSTDHVATSPSDRSVSCLSLLLPAPHNSRSMPPSMCRHHSVTSPTKSRDSAAAAGAIRRQRSTVSQAATSIRKQQSGVVQQWSAPLNCADQFLSRCRMQRGFLDVFLTLEPTSQHQLRSFTFTVQPAVTSRQLFHLAVSFSSFVASTTWSLSVYNHCSAATHAPTHTALLSGAPCLPRPLAQLCHGSLA